MVGICGHIQGENCQSILIQSDDDDEKKQGKETENRKSLVTL